MKASTLLLLPCLCSCAFDASGLMCPQSEPTVVTKIAPIAADCPEWVVLERVSWDSDGLVRRFTASARPADGGPWCDYRVEFEVAEP
jgi:hypothetical protein